MADLNSLLSNAAADDAYNQARQAADTSLSSTLGKIGAGISAGLGKLGDLTNSHLVTPTSAPVSNPNSLDAVSARVSASLAPAAADKQASVADTMSNLTGRDYYSMAVADDRKSGDGLSSASQMEKDLRTMDQISFVLKYGNAGQDVLDRYNGARRNVVDQNMRDRNWGEVATDSLNSVGTAAATGLASIGAWGAGAINDRAGAGIAKNISDFTQQMQGLKSQHAQDMAKQNEAVVPLQDRDNEQTYQDQIKSGMGTVEATARKIGRDFMAGAKNEFSNPTTLAEGSANAVGSLLLTAPVGGAIEKVGEAALKAVPKSTRAAVEISAAIDKAAGRLSLNRGLVGAAERLPMTASIGLQEGAGAYQQTAGDVMGMDFDTLAQQSPRFNELTKTMSPEDARAQLANEAGLQAAPKQFAAGIGTGALVSKFEAHPFQFGTARTLLQNTGKEALEEGTQNASGQIFQNQAEKDTGVDPAKDLFDSVGRQTAQGAIYGAAAAAHAAAPGAVVTTGARAALGAGALAVQGAQALVNRAPGAINAVSDAAPSNLGDVKDTLASIYEHAANVGGKVADVASKAGNAAADLAFGYAPNTSGKVADAYDYTKAKAQKGVDAVKSAFPDVKDVAGKAADKVTGAVSGIKAPSAPNMDFGGVVRNTASLARTGLSAIKPYVSRVTDYFANKGDAVMKVNERNSPVSDEKMADAAQELKAQNDQLAALNEEIANTPDVSDEVKARAADYAQRAVRITQIQPEQSAAWHPAVQSVVGDTTDRYDAIQKMQSFVADTQHSEADRLAVAAQLQADKVELQGMANANPAQLDGLPDDHGLRSYAQGAAAFVQGISQTPGMSRADRASVHLIQKAANLIAPLTEERVATPEGQADAKTIANLAEVAPTELPEGSIKTALKHASKLGLNPDQKRSLEAADGLLEAAKNYAAKLDADRGKNDKPLSAKDLVTRDVTAGESNHPFKKSALQHAQGIAESYRSGDLDTARLQLLDLQKFAQSQSNKLAAINQALVGGNADKGNAVHYEALSGNADRSFYTSEEGVWVDPTHFGSVRLARRVGAEVKFLTDLSNNLATAYPELGVGHLTSTSLDARLTDGTVTDVVKGFKDGSRTVGDTVKKADTVEGKQQTAPAQEAKQPVTSEPAQAASTETKSEVKATAAPQESVQEPVNATQSSAASTGVEESSAPAADKATEVKAEQPVNVSPETKETSNEGTKEKTAPAKAPALLAIKSASDAELVAQFNTLSEQPKRSVGEQAVMEAVRKELDKRGIEAISESDPKRGVEAAFPFLVQPADGGNAFTRSFRMAKADSKGNPPSNLLFHEVPLRGLFDAVKQRIRVLPSKESSGVLEGYRSVFNGANDVAKIMRRNLHHFLTENEDRKGGKQRIPVGERFRDGVAAHRWIDGKVLNLTEEANGQFKYNEQLLQGAALAGMSWWLTSGQQGGVYDEAGAAAHLGIDEGMVGDDILNRVKGTTSTLDAMDSLAAKLTQYWGVRADDNAPEGLAQGIPLSMAGEVLRGLMSAGYLETDDFYVNPNEHDAIYESPTEEEIKELGLKHIQRLVTIKTDMSRNSAEMQEAAKRDRSITANLEALRTYPDLVERAVLNDPVPAYYFGKDRPKVADTQMRNEYVKNTQDQLSAIKNEQETPHYLNETMANLYFDMGRETALSWFGAGDLTDRVLNINHYSALVGQNLTIGQAYDEFENLHAALSGQAAEMGVPITAVPTHYGYNMSRVGRMQMLGRYNPQSTKFIREIMLPTRSTLDLSKAEHMHAFELGLAQALGIKVHNVSADVMSAKLHALLDGEMKPAVEHLQAWLNQKADFDRTPIENAFHEAGQAISPLALHALTEYARFLNGGPAEWSAFTTTKYLEADGMTNGPVNAMALLSTGPFDEQWVSNMRRGGLVIGGNETNTSQWIRSQPDNADLYGVATKSLVDHLNDTAAGFSMRKQFAMRNQMDHLKALMNLFLPDLDYDAKTEKLTIGRGVAKNPLTITIYGSGERGIAGKVANTMLTELYERMSDAAQRMEDAKRGKREITLAQAFFPNDPMAEQHYAKFREHMDALTHDVVSVDQDGNYYFKEQGAAKNDTLDDPVMYALNDAELKNLTTNVQALFIRPMTKAIGDTVGNVNKGATMVRMATQAQSIILGRVFVNRVEAALEERAQKDPFFKKQEFLSAKEVRGVLDGMSDYHPLLKSDDQTFFVAGNQNSEVKADDFGRALDGSLRYPGFVYGPANAGVAGIPFLNIGMGDGKMMQILANDPRVQRTLKIFDGMNMPLDSIMEQSRAANEAVLESWRGNPLALVRDAFLPFLAQVEKDGIESLKLTQSEELALAKAVFGLDAKAGDHTLAESIDAMKELAKYLERGAMQVEARHRVLDRLNLSLDQMSSAGAPHVVSGKIQLSGTDAQIADQMAKMYADELAKLKVESGLVTDETAPRTAEEPKQHAAAMESEEISKQINDYGRINKATGARVLSPSAIKKLVMKGLPNIPAHQKALLNDIRLSLSTKGYSVVTGTAEQLAAYARTKGDEQSASLNRGDSGVTVPDSHTIYIVNPDSEVLTHELIHAATFEKVLAHYEGQSTPEVAEAIGRIEQMLDQFANMDVSRESLGTQQAYADAMAAINFARGQDAISKAKALNEFMAWTLANKDLAALTGKTKVSPLVQLAKAAFEAIKQLIWGRKKLAEKPGDDLFSNLLFNSSIVMRSQPTPQQALRGTSLYHSSAYGSNDRLAQYNASLASMLEAFRTQPNPAHAKTTFQAESNFAAVQAAGLRNALRGAGFLKSPQEATTFELVAAALGTSMHLDANSMALAQELYQHVVKNLEVEHFMRTKPEDNDQNDRHQANTKYNAIVGEFMTTQDRQGRSSLLPVFVGLAIVDDQFRSILNTIGLPERMQSTASSKLDATLENFFGGLMDRLAERTAGLKTEPTVTTAIDALMQHVMKVAAEREDFLAVTGAETFVDTLDKKLVEAIGDLSTKGVDKMQQIIDDPKASPMAKNAAKYAQLSLKMATEKGGNEVAESVVELMNRANAWQPLHDIIYDFVGRTEQNAPVYDMMKIVRSQISQDRQNYREHVPGIIAGKFSRELEDHEWTVLHRALSKTDIAALRQTLKNEEINEILGDAKQHSAAIDALESELQKADPKFFAARQKKAQQLARFMMTGEVGRNLLRNAHAVANLWGENNRPRKAGDHIVNLVDQLTTLYALEQLSPTERNTLLSLAQQEAAGIAYSTDYLVGQRAEELRKMDTINGRARANAFKGYVPETTNSGVHLIVAEDSRYQELTEKSYKRLGDYQGSTADGTKGRLGYYFSDTSAKNVFLQGIFQNVRRTAGGVDVMTGYNNSTMNAGRITDRDQVNRILTNLHLGEKGGEPLMPIFDRNGGIVGFERSIDPEMLEKIQEPQNMARQIGAWRGRQVEEEKAQRFNNALIDALHDRYESDMQKSQSNRLGYVNLFSGTYLDQNPVIHDAVKLWTPETRAAIKAKFGEDAFWVPKDMLHDVTGYRQPSVGDMWTGNSRWSKETQEYVKKTLIGMFGNKAYEYFTNGEKALQNFIGDAKTLIVVKSVVVPMVNAMGNVLQLMSRGVPIKHILTGVPKKIAETNQYVKQRQKQIEIEADLRAAVDDVVKARQLQTQWQVIEDGFKRLSIYPLIKNGEFTAISDATQVGADDVELTSGKWHSFMEAQIAKLPKSFQTAGRYALVTKDTALYKGLQKSVEYGDFIAKAVLYDDLMNRHKLSQEKALGRITEEFVNYDKLPGRFRGYLESVGLLWFYNFKIRATKTAMSMLRNNPVHSLLAYSLPLPDLFSSVGTPLTDNFIAKLFSGQIGYSWGLGQLLHAPQMNPWVNIL